MTLSRQESGIAEHLVGTWDLVSFHDVDDTGDHREGPLGPAPRGTLLYTADGHVAVGMMSTTPGIARPYMGYVGRWHVHDGLVMHRIEISSRADWVGVEQSREAELLGDELMIHATREVDGKPQRRTLHWRRVTMRQ